MKLKIAEEAQLAARTLDLVYSGEQQPESDHFVQSSESQAGINQNRHWRDAKGWFSYRMKAGDARSAILRLTYFGGDNNRNFTISANGQEVAQIKIAARGNQFYSEDYPLPQTVIANAKDGIVEIKFTAAPNSMFCGVYELRLMKGE